MAQSWLLVPLCEAEGVGGRGEAGGGGGVSLSFQSIPNACTNNELKLSRLGAVP